MATIIMTGAALSGCTTTDHEQSTPIIGKSDIKIENARMTPEALWAMGRIGSFATSPDGSQIIYNVSYYSVEANKSHHVLYIMGSDGSNQKL